MCTHRGCNKIRNVSSLGITHKLDLSDIWGIKVDINLRNVYDLNLSFCDGLKIVM